MRILLSPHDDDQALFAAFTCLREKPLVVICFDSYIQPARGERGCSAEERARETSYAARVLGCPVLRLGLRDDDRADYAENALLDTLTSEKYALLALAEVVYAPALQGGNVHHDIVARVAASLYEGQLVQYTTYTKTELYTEGDIAIHPSGEEYRAKLRALECYPSQLRINKPHFDAMLGKSEWLMARGDQRLHLGCGKKLRDGWINYDRLPLTDVNTTQISYVWEKDLLRGTRYLQRDLLVDGIAADANSIDYVYSEDFLEHLPADKQVYAINEIWRVLKPGGVMEHFVPNAGSRNSYGSPTHLSFWNLQTFEHFDVKSPRYESDKDFEGITGGFEKVHARLVNFHTEEDGIRRAQSIHVKYRKVAA